MHLAGGHSTKTNEIYMSMFEMKSNYELDHEYSRKFTELTGAVDVMQVGTRPDDDVNDIIVYYRVPSVSNRGMVMITNMKDSIEV